VTSTKSTSTKSWSVDVTNTQVYRRPHGLRRNN
jgi:hypothetical protein